ncbi:MAG: hypothetical protein Roseis2KO_11220 [Roseivirga sp.]
MTKSEIKNRLHGIIDRIDDGEVLEAVYKLLSQKDKPLYSLKGYELSQEEFEANIEEAEMSIRNGKTFTHAEVIARFKLRSGEE